MAKPNHSFEKRRREMEKKQKKEEKRQRKIERTTEDSVEGVPAEGEESAPDETGESE